MPFINRCGGGGGENAPTICKVNTASENKIIIPGVYKEPKFVAVIDAQSTYGAAVESNARKFLSLIYNRDNNSSEVKKVNAVYSHSVVDGSYSTYNMQSDDVAIFHYDEADKTFTLELYEGDKFINSGRTYLCYVFY